MRKKISPAKNDKKQFTCCQRKCIAKKISVQRSFLSGAMSSGQIEAVPVYRPPQVHQHAQQDQSRFPAGQFPAGKTHGRQQPGVVMHALGMPIRRESSPE